MVRSVSSRDANASSEQRPRVDVAHVQEPLEVAAVDVVNDATGSARSPWRSTGPSPKTAKAKLLGGSGFGGSIRGRARARRAAAATSAHRINEPSWIRRTRLASTVQTPSRFRSRATPRASSSLAQ